MTSRGHTMITGALAVMVALYLGAACPASAADLASRYPAKVRAHSGNVIDSGYQGARLGSSNSQRDWEAAAGRSRAEILCPKRGYAFALGMRPVLSTVTGTAKVVSRGGEGTYLNLHGHLRLPAEKTLWEFYSHLKLWDKVAARLEYAPWKWTGSGHIPSDGNLAGLLLRKDDAIQSDLAITSLILGADYEVSFGRNVVFGPNGDLHIIKWTQRVTKGNGDAMDFSQTLLQPAIGGHLRYEPENTGYFSWFKPYVEMRFSWMSFDGLGLSTWDMAAGVAPPVSRNVDAGFKLGYKQWKLEGNRNRLYSDVAVEGPYLDFALHF
ncbi:MAG: hypothetical protein QG577_879 [Thermodesulfobacteriota bacterium]|nr:hypothetical protein [Thermodesulfobacteriota bacterium]